MDRTRFTELFDNTPTARVLDVMICGREYDYALTDISRSTGLNRQRLRGILDRLVKQNVIWETRKFSGMQMFKISGTHPIATSLIAVSDAMIKLPEVKNVNN